MIRRAPDHSSRLRRGGLGDDEAAERLEALHPEAAMRRREFLARSAALAGAAGLAGAIPARALVAEAAKAQATGTLPRPRNVPIEHFVVLMMENRSFDHYFGWHPDADAQNDGLSYPDLDGNLHPTYRLTPDFQGCGHRDPDHGWDGGRWQWNGGQNDRFFTGSSDGTGSDEFAIGYYLEEDLGFLPHAAGAFTLYDRWFCSIMASTYPNRHYQWGAQSGGQKSNEIPAGDLGNQWETIFDRALAHGLSATYYNSDLPFAALYGQRGISWTRPVADFYADCAAGTLPNVAFVDPPFHDGGGGDGTSADEHPHGDIRLGQAFMSDVAHAVMESPLYQQGKVILVVNYDEWGGFFDHVSPPFVPDERRSRNLDEDFGFAGFRIPGTVISPYTVGGGVSHMQVTHESVLKLISYKFRLGHLNRRHRAASNLGLSFDFANPVFDPPTLPDPAAIVAVPCSAQSGTESGAERPKPHDMTLLETSGYLDRLGFEVPRASFDQIFREPDSVARTLEESNRR